MKYLIKFFKTNQNKFEIKLKSFNYQTIKRNKFDWQKINLVTINNENLHGTLTTLFYKFLKIDFRLNQALFCSSLTTEEEIISKIYY